MMTMGESAARHMGAGVDDLDELARLVEADTGKAPKRSVLSTYRSSFRRHGSGRWIEARRAHTNEASKRWLAENPEIARKKCLLNNCRGSARKRGHECTLTAEDIDAMLSTMTCSVTGLPLTWEHEGETIRNPWAPSIDRIDNALGYVPGNVRVVCWAFNLMRADWPDEVVRTLVEAAHRTLNGTP